MCSVFTIYTACTESGLFRPCESMGRGCKFKRKSQVVDWFQILSRGYDMISPGTYKTQENNGIHNRPNYRKCLLMLGFFHQQNHHHLVSLIWGLVPELRLSVFNQDFLQDQLLHDRILMYWRLTKVHKGILHLDFLLVLCSVYLFFRQFRPPNCSLGNQKKRRHSNQTGNGKHHDIPLVLVWGHAPLEDGASGEFGWDPRERRRRWHCRRPCRRRPRRGAHGGAKREPVGEVSWKI